MIRAVRDSRYKYLKNFYPEKPYYLPLEYREKMAKMQQLLMMEKNNELDTIQNLLFRKEKANEELFDTDLDPYKGDEALRQSFMFIAPGNCLVIPSVALPMGVDNGLPTGIQIYSE